MLGLRLRLNPPFSRFFTQRSRADESLEKAKAIWELEKYACFLRTGEG